MKYKSKPVPLPALLTATFFAVYQVLVAFTILLLLFTNFPVWVGVKLGTVVAPTIYLMVILSTFPFLLRERLGVIELIKHPYIWWCALVMLLHLSGFLRSGGTVEAEAAQIDLMEQFLLAPTIAFLVYSIPHRVFLPFFSALIFIVPALVIYGFFDPTFFYDDNVFTTTAGRSGGPWFNANVAAEAVLLAFVITRAHVPKVLFVTAFALAGLAVIATGSRSGMIGWLIMCIYFLTTKRLPKLFMLAPALMAIFYSSVLIFIEDIVRSIPEQAAGAENLLARLSFMTGTVSADDGGGDERGNLAINAFKEALERPILGHGFDYEDSFVQIGTGSHNLLAQFWYFHGLLGIAAVFSIAYLLHRYTKGYKYFNLNVFMFVWFTLFSHNIFESLTWMVFFAMVFFDVVKSEKLGVQQFRSSKESKPVGRVKGKRRRSKERLRW